MLPDEDSTVGGMYYEYQDWNRDIYFQFHINYNHLGRMDGLTISPIRGVYLLETPKFQNH